jgi:hypothetical protein
MGKVINASYKKLIVEPKEKRPLWRIMRRWEHNIKMDLKEIRCQDVNWIHLA